MYRKESPIRSLLKGISWRFIATLDTVLIVLVYTCWNGSCSIDHAVQIGLVEFVFKLGVYFVHERIWQFVYKDGVLSNKEILSKTISWRIVATSMTFVIAGTILDSFNGFALAIAITELFTKMLLYYGHEKLWLILPLGKVRSFFKRKLKWRRTL